MHIYNDETCHSYTNLLDKLWSVNPALIQDGFWKIVPKSDEIIISREMYKTFVLLTFWFVPKHETFDIPVKIFTNESFLLLHVKWTTTSYTILL